MKRIENVLRALQEQGGQPVTATTLAAALGYSRANVSSDLNQLCKSGNVEKEGTKPVYYRAKNGVLPTYNEAPELETFEYKNPSLSSCIAQAKAAVFYPPSGMPILLLGETGVGKSMLVDKICDIAKGAGVFAPGFPYVIFNCADYSNNPQLLMSYLFGSQKGAYTGALEDREGLLDKADGGILFLDEVHRLPPEGQEMLFSFIDRGRYRRLGDTAERRARVQLVCATTENPDSALLSTFVRRIPMLIRIPNLARRTDKERFTLLQDMFLAESAKIGHPIQVSLNAVRCIMTYPCPNNIGQLKADIQILCARAYSNFMSGAVKQIHISGADLPEYISDAIFSDCFPATFYSNLRTVGNHQVYCFDASNTAQSHYTGSSSLDFNVYDAIETKTAELRMQALGEEEINAALNREVDQYYDEFINSSTRLSRQQLSNLVSSDILFVTEHIIGMAERSLEHNFPSKARNGLAMHIYSAVSRMKMGHSILNPQMNEIRKNSPLEFNVALEALQIINNELFMNLPLDEAAYLTPFFRNRDIGKNKNQEETVHILVMMHGSTTATSMVEAVAQILNHPLTNIDPFDVRMDIPLFDIYSKVRQHIARLPDRACVLFLYDMGSISNIIEKLREEFLTLRIRSFAMASTLHIVEAVQDAELGYSFDYTCNQLGTIHSMYGRPASTAELHLVEPAQLLVAALGTNHAESAALAKRLEKELPPNSKLVCVVQLHYTDEADLQNRLSLLKDMGRVIAAVAPRMVDCMLPAPFFVLDKEGVDLAPIMNTVNLEMMIDSTTRSLANVTKLLPVNETVPHVRDAVSRIAGRLGLEIDANLMICSLCHLVCTMERIAAGERIEGGFTNMNAYMRRYPKVIRVLREECAKLGDQIGLAFTTEDICAYSLFFTNDIEIC